MGDEVKVEDRRNGHLPPGVQASPTDAYSEEEVRYEADSLANDLSAPGGFDDAGAFREALSYGSTPAEIFGRTEIANEDDAIRWANFFARRIKILRLDPEWAEEPVVKMRSPGAVFGYFKMMFMMSKGRMSRKEALSAHARLISPELLNEDANSKEPFWRRPARRRAA